MSDVTLSKENQENAQSRDQHVHCKIPTVRNPDSMNANKRRKLEAAGWSVGSTADFLALTQAEEMLVEMRLSLASALRSRRIDGDLTQAELAKRIGSSQSRLAKMEAADPSVSFELLMKSLVSLGATRDEIGAVIGARQGGRTSKAGAARKRKAKTEV